MKTLAIIVNYKSRDLTLKAVDSVLGSVSMGPLEIVVVDNSEDPDEAEMLGSNLPSGVQLLVSPENLGFGRACNWAVERFRGDLILLINPDAKLLPGCLFSLQKTICLSQKVAAVSPQVFWEEGLQFFLPPSHPQALLQLQSYLASCGPVHKVNRIISLLWRSCALKVWRAQRPVRVSNLSGGMVLLRRKAIKRAGGLFDPRFFLYLEDTDLFLRLRKAGYTLLIEPKAWAVHYYDQCAQKDWEWKRAVMNRSLTLFLEKHPCHFGYPLGRVLGGLMARRTNGTGSAFKPGFISPFMLKVPARIQNGWLFEMSPNPSFIPSAGRFGRGPWVEFPEACWRLLAPGQYFGRLGRPKGFETHFVKFSWRVGDSTSLECNGPEPYNDRVEGS